MPAPAFASAPALSSALVADWKIDGTVGKVDFFSAAFEEWDSMRDQRAHSDMTEKEIKWYSSLWAFDLKTVDKTVSGEYILERPPKKPGGSTISYIIMVLLFLFAAIEGADCDIMDKNVPAASSEEGAFSFLMAQACLLVVAALFLLCMVWRGKDNRKTKSLHSRTRGKPRSRLKKSSKVVKKPRSRMAVNKGRESKDNKNSITERDKQLDQLFEETLDQDIERCKSSDGQLKRNKFTERERERIRKRTLSGLDPKSAPVTPDPSENSVLPSPRRRELNTFRDLFNIELDRFTAIGLSVRVQHNGDLDTLLWNKFRQEIKRLGKDFAALETHPKELQHKIIECFFCASAEQHRGNIL